MILNILSIFQKRPFGFFFPLLFLFSCLSVPQRSPTSNGPVLPGAIQQAIYLPLLQGKKVALVANSTSYVGATHLVDVLLEQGINVRKIFVPEHGFRGDHGAGELVNDAVDPSTGLPLIALYGAVKKPTQAMLEDVDVVVFDIQDVGVRCYTEYAPLCNGSLC